jgi:hypothetical protein|nr:MAG TPA: hypothetical protein [Caudoviricetes sp.]
MARGGKREGAGRKTLTSNKIASNIKLSPQTREIVERYSKALGLNKSDFIDRFLFLYVEQCEEILKCPNCGEPVLWTAVQATAAGEAIVECRNCKKELSFEM